MVTHDTSQVTTNCSVTILHGHSSFSIYFDVFSFSWNREAIPEWNIQPEYDVGENMF